MQLLRSCCVALGWLLLCSLWPFTSGQLAAADEASSDPVGTLMLYRIRPSDTDPAIHDFNEEHYVLMAHDAPAGAQLVIFMPGTNGKPSNAVPLLRVIAQQGYRVIGLEYNDSPAVVQVCPRDPSPACSGNFRRQRIFGDASNAVVHNSAAETIVNRLAKVLQYLDQRHPDEGWSGYLSDGVPRWDRIVVSGLSQGAGMAAYVAKHEAVARVVLFSSPWDFTQSPHAPAPWLADVSATPAERWFAEYHRRENTAALIARAYAVLKIPSANIRVFDLDLPADFPRSRSDNPFHGSTIRLVGYEPQWRFLFGHSP